MKGRPVDVEIKKALCDGILHNANTNTCKWDVDMGLRSRISVSCSGKEISELLVV